MLACRILDRLVTWDDTGTQRTSRASDEIAYLRAGASFFAVAVSAVQFLIAWEGGRNDHFNSLFWYPCLPTVLAVFG